eukprot:TRINITY_DN3844_c0_g1_i1.p1 TRINITY_DN3844_c0_g1~~TRINITY_DN3844_c0_g1_i1.p1  ORF type:complete len:464 (+),score=118.73 TRINITY_DN3844_c0_g1_i1:192-1583(+)
MQGTPIRRSASLTAGHHALAARHGQASAHAVGAGALRSSTLRRAGTLVSEPPSTPPGAADLPGAAQGGASSSSASVAAAAVAEEPCGLTPASLKHVRRQRDRLEEEKGRVQAELSAVSAQLREQRERNESLETEVAELKAEIERLRALLSQAEARERAARERAETLERRCERVEGLLAEREAEVDRLKQALEDQRLLTKEVCEASERQARDCSRDQSFEAEMERLRRDKENLQRDLERKAQEQQTMMLQFAGAVAAAEKAMVLAKNFEMLRAAKIADAINQKVELHISVPRVTLHYNNAPPLSVSVAKGLGDDNIVEFLKKQVFPHFEPLWAKVDSFDTAPDGESKKMYSTRMLDRLTDAIKAFIAKSQQADGGEADGLKLVRCEKYGGPDSADGRGAGTSASASSTAGSAQPPRARAGVGAGAAADLDDAARQRLLDLLRSGDDRALDEKMREIMEAKSRAQ